MEEYYYYLGSHKIKDTEFQVFGHSINFSEYFVKGIDLCTSRVFEKKNILIYQLDKKNRLRVKIFLNDKKKKIRRKELFELLDMIPLENINLIVSYKYSDNTIYIYANVYDNVILPNLTKINKIYKKSIHTL